jgi:hypothetical protein
MLTVEEVTRELDTRGWTPEARTLTYARRLVAAAISSLVNRTGELEHTGRRGTYRLMEPKIEPPARTAGGSSATADNRLFLGSVGGDVAGEGT